MAAPSFTVRLAYAGLGILATLVGMAAGHLVAAFVDPASSPVLAVGSTVIDLTPTPVKEWAVQRFGTADKPILVGSVMAGAVVLAAIGGLLARRRFALGALVLVLLVAVAGAAAVLRPGAGPLDIIPALATALAGVGALWWLTHAASGGSEHSEHSETAHGSTRRGVLIAAGVLAAAAAAMGGAGRLVSACGPTPATSPCPGPPTRRPPSRRAWRGGTPGSPRSGPPTTASTGSTPGSASPPPASRTTSW